MDKLKSFFSKKLIVTVLAGFFVPFLSSKGVPDTVVQWLMGVIAVYLGGQSLVDAAAANKATK